MTIAQVVSPSGKVFDSAAWELGAEDIWEKLGVLIEHSFFAFRADHRYVADMAEHAALLTYKRQLWACRNEVSAEESDPAVIRSRTRALMEERGVEAPKRTHRRRRVA